MLSMDSADIEEDTVNIKAECIDPTYDNDAESADFNDEVSSDLKTERNGTDNSLTVADYNVPVETVCVGVKRKSLSLATKLQVIREIASGQKKRVVALKYDIGYSTVSTIWAAQEKIKAAASTLCSQTKRLRKTIHDNLDLALLKWYTQQRLLNVAVSGPEMRAEAERLAQSLGIEEFQCSRSWVERFKKRHEISFGKNGGSGLTESQQEDMINNGVQDAEEWENMRNQQLLSIIHQREAGNCPPDLSAYDTAEYNEVQGKGKGLRWHTKLISLVQKRRELYDKSCYETVDCDRINKSWAEIGQKMGGWDAKEVRTKWRELRERFLEETKLKDIEDYEVRWPLYDKLSFLQPHLIQQNNSSPTMSSPHSSDSASSLFYPANHDEGADTAADSAAVADTSIAVADIGASPEIFSSTTPLGKKRKNYNLSTASGSKKILRTESTDKEISDSLESALSQLNDNLKNLKDGAVEGLCYDGAQQKETEEALCGFISHMVGNWLGGKRSSRQEWVDAMERIVQNVFAVTRT